MQLCSLASPLKTCRERDMGVIYTAHVHRSDGCDMGRCADFYPPVAGGQSLVDGIRSAEIYPDFALAAGKHVIKKHRYSGFFATDMDLILRNWASPTW